jgi:hypothetical protein
MKKIAIFIVLSFCVFYNEISCTNKKSIKMVGDDFYISKGGFDYARLPLLKPYDAKTIAGGKEWSIALKHSYDMTIPNVKTVNVIGDSLIIVHSTNTLLNGQDVKESWYIILPAMQLEKGYKDYQLYLKHLKKLGFHTAPELQDIHKANSDFQYNN